ncbi:MAG: LD-carboxypeptidase, partial [Bacteroidota bacterium]
MYRRTAIKHSLLSVSGLLAASSFAVHPNFRRVIKPTRLQVGQTVALIAPSGPVPADRVQEAVSNLEDLGLKVKVGENIHAKNGHNAGTDQQRLSDLHGAFRDPTVSAIWCVRGGDGAYRLLPNIDYKLIRKNPKILIGYSDITALLQAFYTKVGLVGFHGPIGATAPEYFTNFRANMEAVIFQGGAGHLIKQGETTETFQKGTASGPLVGGNLSL